MITSAKRKRKPTNRRAWDNIDSLLKQSGIHCGMPISFGEEGFETVGNTRDSALSVLLDDNRGRSDRDGKSENECKVVIRNAWRMSRPWNGNYATVIIFEEDGKLGWLPKLSQPPAGERLNMWLETGGKRLSSTLMSAERKARNKLKSMLSGEQWRAYELEGCFIERGPRSGLIYFVRKGRPTLALRICGDNTIPLCALCLHPLGYYKGTWAGALAPSDEVISHLLYIRGDEYSFWKRANHISIDDPRSGV